MKFNGTTEQAKAPILSADFWKKGVTVEGMVTGSYQTRNGVCYEITLRKPIKVNGHDEEKVSIGGLKGFEMALRASGADRLEVDDAVIIKCTGLTPAEKKGYSAMVNFDVSIDRG